MALSNWDVFALNEKSESTSGSFVSPLGVKVEIYKNWLYVEDAKAWVPGARFIEPVVMQIQHGEVSYKDVNVIATRDEDGVYALVFCGYGAEMTFMVALGVYGPSSTGRADCARTRAISTSRRPLDSIRRRRQSGWPPSRTS